jgi:divinyl protochlorophyllide a 8-vinyl-reductase
MNAAALGAAAAAQGPGAASSRIGPNAITRVAEVLPARVGSRRTLDLFEHAGLAHYLRQPPERMVDENEVMRLHGVLREELGAPLALEVAREAGLRTADYLLANRIPKPAQALMRGLPAALAARVLLAAISGHAWTFAGSGRFTARAGLPVLLEIRNNPLARGVDAAEPACAFYAATFERLFRTLVRHDAEVVEVSCEACGDDACRFEVRW